MIATSRGIYVYVCVCVRAPPRPVRSYVHRSNPTNHRPIHHPPNPSLVRSLELTKETEQLKERQAKAEAEAASASEAEVGATAVCGYTCVKRLPINGYQSTHQSHQSHNTNTEKVPLRQELRKAQAEFDRLKREIDAEDGTCSHIMCVYVHIYGGRRHRLGGGKRLSPPLHTSKSTQPPTNKQASCSTRGSSARSGARPSRRYRPRWSGRRRRAQRRRWWRWRGTSR